MIVNPSDIRKVRPVASNVNDEKRLLPYIDEAEKLFVIPQLGAALYKLITTTPADYTTLFQGGFYDNDTKYFAGLTEAIGYLVYSRFVRNQNVNVTAFGVVQKQGQYSDPVDEKTIVRTANDAEKIGLEYLKQCLDFLNFGKEKCDQRTFKSRCKFKAIG